MQIEKPVRVNFLAGTCIEQAAEEAQDFADQINADVRFTHNGVTCEAQPRGDSAHLVRSFRALMGAVANSSRDMSLFRDPPMGDL